VIGSALGQLAGGLNSGLYCSDSAQQQAQMQNMYSQQAQLRNAYASYKGNSIERCYADNTYRMNVVGVGLVKVPYEQAQTKGEQAFEDALNQALRGRVQVEVRVPPKLEEVKVTSETIPDVSLTRVLKWAIVLVVAMGLGKKVWSMFGDKITAQVHKAIGDA